MAAADVLKSILGVGSATIAAAVGYVIWTRQQHLGRRRELAKQRQEAYREVWEQLQDAEIAIRKGTLSVDEYREVLSAVNVLIMKREPFLDAGDRELASKYLQSFREFTETFVAQDPELKSHMATTGEIPPHAVHLSSAVATALRMRDEFKKKALDSFR